MGKDMSRCSCIRTLEKSNIIVGDVGVVDIKSNVNDLMKDIQRKETPGRSCMQIDIQVV